MKIIKFNNREYRLISFLITVGILLFCFFLIPIAVYKYHLETEEKRLLLLNTNQTEEKKKEEKPKEEKHRDENGCYQTNEYYADGKLMETYFFNKNDDKIKEIKYDYDGKKIIYIIEYFEGTKKKYKEIFYKDDGETIKYINENDKDTGRRIKFTKYFDDYSQIQRIETFDKDTGQLIKILDN